MSKEQSFIIAVSLRSGCYRHIQISADSTLLTLSSIILDAFHFMDDHLHAFFMDNKKWSQGDCYYSDGMEDQKRYTSQYKLNQLNLAQGKKFKYVFDFGDEWEFQCRILRVLDSKTDVPKIVKSKGKPPKQYGDPEEDEEE